MDETRRQRIELTYLSYILIFDAFKRADGGWESSQNKDHLNARCFLSLGLSDPYRHLASIPEVPPKPGELQTELLGYKVREEATAALQQLKAEQKVD
ncbi:hypothetical protein F2P81_006320 [Scophthalmus maximus]|uniref:Uncharacterized protein n=1 Tax=Scophthalmus maximus TaxID=52904 RepID=A0A6A4TDT6_SCOMX|nr:hypothetical protein F2P81_006320 [Scophthalmus maximus]